MQRRATIVNRRRTIRNLTIFTCIVWAIGWIAAAVQARIVDESAQQLGLLIWLVTPLATVLVLRAFAGDGWKDFGLAPSLRGHAFGYAVAVLCHPVGAMAVLLVGYVIGLVAFPDFSAPRLAAVFAAGLAPSFVKNVFEEFAWRGYLTPKVHSLGLNDYVGHGAVGLIWAGWHVPYFLYLVDPAALNASTGLSLPVFIAMAVPSLVAVSVVYGELRLLTGSVWPPVIAHAAGNALIDVLILRGFVRVEPGAEFWASPGYQGVFTIVFFAIIGVVLHRWRTQ
jgi:membrane protease YdiL (CAAX protease family)